MFNYIWKGLLLGFMVLMLDRTATIVDRLSSIDTREQFHLGQSQSCMNYVWNDKTSRWDRMTVK